MAIFPFHHSDHGSLGFCPCAWVTSCIQLLFWAGSRCKIGNLKLNPVWWLWDGGHLWHDCWAENLNFCCLLLHVRNVFFASPTSVRFCKNQSWNLFISLSMCEMQVAASGKVIVGWDLVHQGGFWLLPAKVMLVLVTGESLLLPSTLWQWVSVGQNKCGEEGADS